MSTVSPFLDSFVNHQEDTNKLAEVMAHLTNSKLCALFVKGRPSKDRRYSIINHKHSNSTDHILLAKYPIIDINSSHISFHSPKDITGLHISNSGNDLTTFLTDEVVLNILIIPVISNTERLGTICLYNSTSDYDDESVRILSPYICITQLILGKEQILLDYKRVCNDKSYASKDIFLANMSHEIRTPLNGVIGYGQLLANTELNQTQKGYVNSMNQCSIQLMKIINDILDFSKLSSGKMKINSECFQLRDITVSINGAIGQHLNNKRQKLIVSIDQHVPDFIVMDKQKLIQILINLVSNASKFTDISGLIRIEILNNTPTDIQELMFSVTDNGIGISKADQCKLFNTYMQIESSIYKSGTGLGLAISKKLCELLGGDISVNSSLGNGSTFIFTVKYQPIESFAKSIQTNVELLKGKTILVVDDNADNRIVISEMLESWEMHPVAVGTALEALRMILGNRYPFSLGLIDICMPGTTGTELAKQIKEERPFFPLIALSSIDSFVSSSEFECKLDKPINKIQLFNSIHNILVKNINPSSYIGQSNTVYPSSTSSIDKFNKSARILIAEDIEYNRRLIASMLESLGYTNVSEAEDGQVTYDMIEKSYADDNLYDILLLDIRMPQMDGYDVMHTMNLRNWKIPKIIVITASVSDEDREKCATLGVEYFISKPVDLTELKNVLLCVSEAK